MNDRFRNSVWLLVDFEGLSLDDTLTDEVSDGLTTAGSTDDER